MELPEHTRPHRRPTLRQYPAIVVLPHASNDGIRHVTTRARAGKHPCHSRCPLETQATTRTATHDHLSFIPIRYFLNTISMQLSSLRHPRSYLAVSRIQVCRQRQHNHHVVLRRVPRTTNRTNKSRNLKKPHYSQEDVERVGWSRNSATQICDISRM